MKNIDNPDFYLVETELAKHDFYRHIFPQITKFFAFYKNPKSQNELIEKIFALIQSDQSLENEFKQYLKGKEIFKFLKDTVENNQNILVVINEMVPELTEMTDTYTEWSKMVRIVVLKEYQHNGESILSLTPEFESVAIGEVDAEGKETATEKVPKQKKSLDGLNITKEIYFAIKSNY